MNKDRATWAWGAAIVVLTLLFYIPAMKGGFIWDDDDYVFNNKLLLTLDGLWRIWLSKESVQYYPLVFTTFWVEHKLWGFDPTGYHVVNVLIHSANAVLVWMICKRLNLKGAWVAAVIFALHPVHVESVAWITERKNVLSALFYLLAFLAFLKFEDEERRKFYALSLVLFVLALLSKTVACTLPAAFLIARWMRGREINLKYALFLVPYLAVGLVMGLVTVWWERSIVGTTGAEWDFGLFDRLTLPGRVPWFYAYKILLPINLSFIYQRWAIDATASWQWLYTFATIGALALLFALRKRLGRAPLAAVAFFIVTLFPALGFIKVFPFLYSFTADHFQYLASLGIIVLVVGAAARIAEGLKPVGYIVAGIVIIALGLLTWKQGYIYKDVETLWRDVLRKNPTALIAYNNLGVELTRQERHAEAVQNYSKLVELNPKDFWGRVNLGNSLERMKRFDDAAVQYEAALAIKPDSAEVLNYLGANLAQRGFLSDAMSRFEAAMKLEPSYVDSYKNMATALMKSGKPDEAVRYYERALELTPGDASAYNNAGVALAIGGRLEEAIVRFNEALRLDPDNADARRNLDRALADKK